ncbi:MAG TPA: phosphatase PAP2 family protein [Armatimonadaceae bacterium]|nr:phosphatase PAP2 family protein [Armatimonadaceae bacterium]
MLRHYFAERRRQWHLGGLVLVALAVIGAFVVPVREAGAVDWFARRASNEVNTVFQAAGIVALLVAAFFARSRGAATLVAAVMLGVTAAAHLLKLTTGPMLPRPTGSPGGFPSAHATAVCALAYLLTERWPAGAPLWYGLAALISWSRWEAHGHYPYQILAGVLLGLGLAYFLAKRLGPSEPGGVTVAAGIGAEGEDAAG